MSLLGILMIMCKVVGDNKQTGNETPREYNHPPVDQDKYADVFVANSNMPDYFRSSINRAADRRASNVLTQKIHNEFGDVFQELGVLKAHLAYR